MDPILLTGDTTAADILTNIRDTLSAVTVDTDTLFSDVRGVDDIESFKEAGDLLEGTVAGVYGGPPAQGEPTDNCALKSYRLAVMIGVRFNLRRSAGADERAAVEEMNRLTDLVRQALRLDKSRGGKAVRIEWGGRILDGTDLDGDPRLDARKPNQSFYTFSVPIACGWELPQ